MAFLLIDDSVAPEPSRRPDRIRVPWRVVPAFTAAVTCLTVGMSTDGVVGTVAVIGAFAASCRALDRALPYSCGLHEHRQ